MTYMWYIGDILLASVYALVSSNLLDVQSNMGMQITLLLCVRERQHSSDYHTPSRTIVQINKISDRVLH